MKLYMFRTVRLSIIRSSFTVHSTMVYVIQICRQLSSRSDRKLSTNLYDIYYCWVYTEKIFCRLYRYITSAAVTIENCKLRSGNDKMENIDRCSQILESKESLFRLIFRQDNVCMKGSGGWVDTFQVSAPSVSEFTYSNNKSFGYYFLHAPCIAR